MRDALRVAVLGGITSLAGLAAAAAADTASRPMFGFSAEEGAREQGFEQRFDANLNPADLRAWLKSLSSDANHVGSPHDKANAEFVRDLFKQWGWDAHIEVFDVLYPTLKQHTLELIAPTKFVASLTEPPIDGDATSTLTDGLPPLQRVRRGWGCERGARVSQLRHAR